VPSCSEGLSFKARQQPFDSVCLLVARGLCLLERNARIF
jgi:hypothetical protein